MGWKAIRSAAGIIVPLCLASCDPLERAGDGSLVLGAILPLTGPDAADGQGVLAGMRLAAGHDDTGVIIQAVDGEGAPGPSARRFRELSREPAVRAIAGGWFAATARTLGAISLAEEIGFVALSPLAAPPQRAGGPHALHRLDSLGSAAARFAREDLDAGRAGILVLPGHEASQRLARSFHRAFEHLAGSVVWSISPNEQGKLALPPGPEEKVDVIWVAGPSQWAVRCVDLGRSGREAAVLLADGWDRSALPDLDDRDVSVFVATFFAESDPSRANRDFLAACREKGIEPTDAVALGWDTVMLVREAGLAGGASRDGIRRSLQAGTSVEGATGRVCVSPMTGPAEAPAVCAVSPAGQVFLRRVEAVSVPVEGEA